MPIIENGNSMFSGRIIKANGQDIHTTFAGSDDAPVMLMLHGFPENWRAWADVARHLAQDYHLILPDQRGFNRSSKPAGVSDYETKHLVQDMIGLLDALGINTPIALCGHDWGASVAYAMAMRHSERFSHLIIANGVHPVCFQKSLFAAGPQTKASQYMNVLRQDGMEEHMSADNFAKLFRMFEKFSSAPWLNEEKRAEFVEAWSQTGSMAAMLNWYRGTPMVVPPLNAPARAMPITDAMREKYHIAMPHLLLWGDQDTALLEESRADIGEFSSDLKLVRNDKGSHWILHEHPVWIANEIRTFLTT